MPRAEDAVPPLTLLLYCIIMIVTAILNSLSYKKMLNAYKSQDPVNHPHNYEFYVNELNVLMYFLTALGIIYYKKHFTPHGKHWFNSQTFYTRQFFNMGLLDSAAGFLSCVGGAFVGGAVQSLINQTTIPMTLMLSKIFLQSKFTKRQNLGALIIVLGAVFSVLPSFLHPPDASSRSSTTSTGVVVFLLSVVPGAFSNVYKEYAFKTSENSVDVYYMTTWVSLFQITTGMFFLPTQSLKALGGIPWSEMGSQFVDGTYCTMGINARPGDDCEGAGLILLGYVVINFLYNIFSLLVVKHGSASLSVIAAAVALPLTNMSFSAKWLMGRDYEPFDYVNLLSTLVVLSGFILYSRSDAASDEDPDLWTPRTRKIETSKPKGKTLTLAAAGGSMAYLRPRSDSDPTTPGYTPIMVAKMGKGGTVDRLNQSMQGGSYGGMGETVPLVAGGGWDKAKGEEDDEFEPSSV